MQVNQANYRDTTLHHFAACLAKLRRQNGFTQKELAEQVGISTTHLRRYEGRGSQPTLGVIKKLAVALNTSADLLLFDEGERQPDDTLALLIEGTSKLDRAEKHVIKKMIAAKERQV